MGALKSQFNLKKLKKLKWKHDHNELSVQVLVSLTLMWIHIWESVSQNKQWKGVSFEVHMIKATLCKKGSFFFKAAVEKSRKRMSTALPLTLTPYISLYSTESLTSMMEAMWNTIDAPRQIFFRKSPSLMSPSNTLNFVSPLQSDTQNIKNKLTCVNSI